MTRGVEIVSGIIETMRAAWVADAEFVARGSVISAPRVQHYQGEPPAEYVDIQRGAIELVDEISVSPKVELRRATLLVYGIVDAGVFPDPLYLGDPAAASVLALLNPLEALLERKIEGALRAIESSNEDLEAWSFADETPIVSAEGGRLRAAGRFRYTLDFVVEASVDDEEVVDLEGGDIDYELAGGGATTPHAEDKEDF